MSEKIDDVHKLFITLRNWMAGLILMAMLFFLIWLKSSCVPDAL